MGIVSAGMFLPAPVLTADEIAQASGLPKWVVTDKLGINRKHIRDPNLHPNVMATRAAEQCLERAGSDPKSIDVVLCTTEEWKEYSLWTAGIDLANEIGAANAWGIDVHMRCATTIASLKLARSLMRDDPSINTVLIAGGYVLSDFVDFANQDTAFLFNLGSGAGALLVQRGWPYNQVLGTHLISDGSMSRHVIVPASGTIQHPSDQAVKNGLFKFASVEPEAMKARLSGVSTANWMLCIDEALRKSGLKPDGAPYTRDDINYLNMILVKPSAHRQMLDLLGLEEDQSCYLGHIGHIGEQDSIISIIEGERTGRLTSGDLMVVVGAGIGYVWGAAIVKWGPCQ